MFRNIANAVDAKVGLWEVTTQMDMPGMAFQMPPMTQSQCITEDDLVPKRTEAGEQCTVDSHGVNSNAVIWQVSCQTDAGDMTGNGKITYQGETFQVVSRWISMGLKAGRR